METRKIAGGGRVCEARVQDGVALVEKLKDKFFGKRVGEAKRDEVNRFLGLEMRQIAAGAGGGGRVTVPPSWLGILDKIIEW